MSNSIYLWEFLVDVSYYCPSVSFIDRTAILFYCNLDFGHDHAERSTYSLVLAFFTDGLMLTLIMVFIVVVMTLFPAPKLQNTLKPQHSHHCVCGNLSCLSFSLSNAQIFPLTHLSRSPVSRRC